MQLILKKNQKIDDLPNIGEAILVSVLNDNGEYGFQDPQSHEVQTKLLLNSLFVSENLTAFIFADNIFQIFSLATLSKYAVFMHNTKNQELIINEWNIYNKNRIINEGRIKKNLDLKNYETSKLLFNLMDQSNFERNNFYKLQNCDYLSIWPKYWGPYGEHCYIVSNDLQKAQSDIIRKSKSDFN